MSLYRRTPRGTTVLLLSAVLISLGVVGTLASQAFLLYAGVSLFLFYYASKLLLQLKVKALDKLEVERKFPRRVGEGELLDVDVAFANKTFVTLPLEVVDSFPPFFRLRFGANAAVINVPARGYSVLHYRLSPTSIGSNGFGPLRLVTRDIAGLFFYERSVGEEAPEAVEVTPAGKALTNGVLTAVAMSTYGGSITSRRKGEGLEFADIRRYEPGDPYKRIEWHSTARANHLMVRELSAETQLNVMIILDSTESMAYGEAGRTKLDFAARAVASLIGYLSKRGDFVGLTVIQGKDPATVIPLARGQTNASRLLGTLGRIRPVEAPADALRRAVSRCLALGGVKGKTLFFVITGLDSERDLQPLKQLLQVNHEAIVVSPYTPLFEAHGLEGLDKTIFSIRTTHELRIRKRLLKQALSLGIPVMDVGPDDLFGKLVLRVEELRRKGGS